MFYYNGEDGIVKLKTSLLPLVNALCLHRFDFLRAKLVGVKNGEYELELEQINDGFINHYDFLVKLFSLQTHREFQNYLQSFRERSAKRTLKSGMRDLMKYAYTLLQEQGLEIQYLVMDMIFRLRELSPSDKNKVLNLISLAAELLGKSFDVLEMARQKKLLPKKEKYINIRDEIIIELGGILYPSHCYPQPNQEETEYYLADNIFVLENYPLNKQEKKTVSDESREW